MEEAVRKAVELSGGMDFIKAGQTVLIKPNVTGAVLEPDHDQPGSAVRRHQAGQRARAEADHRGRPQLFADLRHLDAQDDRRDEARRASGRGEPGHQRREGAGRGRRAGRLPPASWNCWAARTRRHVAQDQAGKGRQHWPNGFELAELLFAVDHVINVPVIKTHFQAWFTMSMKAFVGMSHHRTRREFHTAFKGNSNLLDQKSSGSRRRLGPEGRKQDIEEVTPLVNRVAELNLGITPALNILDGTKSFVFGGPSHGDTVEPKLIVASRDRIAADATGVAVLKRYGTERRLQRFSVWENPFIQHGIKIGLGIDSRGQAEAETRRHGRGHQGDSGESRLGRGITSGRAGSKPSGTVQFAKFSACVPRAS